MFSIFNYFTLSEFYAYLIDKNLIRKDDWHHSLYLAIHPSHYSAKNMPMKLKRRAREKAFLFVDGKAKDFPLLNKLVRDAIIFADESHTWKNHKAEFFKHTLDIDRLREESFFNVFPELAPFVMETE